MLDLHSALVGVVWMPSQVFAISATPNTAFYLSFFLFFESRGCKAADFIWPDLTPVFELLFLLPFYFSSFSPNIPCHSRLSSTTAVTKITRRTGQPERKKLLFWFLTLFFFSFSFLPSLPFFSIPKWSLPSQDSYVARVSKVIAPSATVSLYGLPIL